MNKLYIDHDTSHRNLDTDVEFIGYTEAGKKVTITVPGLKYGDPTEGCPSLKTHGWYIQTPSPGCINVFNDEAIINLLRNAHPEWDIVDER